MTVAQFANMAEAGGITGIVYQSGAAAAPAVARLIFNDNTAGMSKMEVLRLSKLIYRVIAQRDWPDGNGLGPSIGNGVAYCVPFGATSGAAVTISDAGTLTGDVQFVMNSKVAGAVDVVTSRKRALILVDLLAHEMYRAAWPLV